jgi:hypothetical protein
VLSSEVVPAQAGQYLLNDSLYLFLSLLAREGPGGDTNSTSPTPTSPGPTKGATVRSWIPSRSRSLSSISSSLIPANQSVWETIMPSLRLLIRGSSVSSNILSISVDTPGKVAKRMPSASSNAP